MVFFFFFKQKTAYEMLSGDWSSDVCSSDLYGITSSPLQGGLPSDRLVAEWWLKSQRVENLLRSVPQPKFETVRTISVPAHIYQWKATPDTRDRAREVQDCNRRDFLQAFSDGLAVLGYDRDEQGNGKFLLGEWNEKCLYPA